MGNGLGFTPCPILFFKLKQSDFRKTYDRPSLGISNCWYGVGWGGVVFFYQREVGGGEKLQLAAERKLNMFMSPGVGFSFLIILTTRSRFIKK